MSNTLDTAIPINEQIIEKLKEVYDPEISVNIYDLGLVYGIAVSPEGLCTVTMTLTSAFCPAADYIIADVEGAVQSVPSVSDVRVDITFEPQWGPEHMSEDAKMILGMFD